jgi:hypothetical protein
MLQTELEQAPTGPIIADSPQTYDKMSGTLTRQFGQKLIPAQDRHSQKLLAPQRTISVKDSRWLNHAAGPQTVNQHASVSATADNETSYLAAHWHGNPLD